MKKAICVITYVLLLQILFAQHEPSKIPDRLVVLTFDDAVSNHATFVAPLLKEYNFGATFYVCEFPPDFATNKKQYMTWEQIKQISDMGFEIGNHTGHHVGVKNISDDKFITELNFLDSVCAKNNIPNPTTFAYPGCGYSADNISVLKKHQINFARTCETRPYYPAKDDPFRIPCFVIQGKDTSVFYNAVHQSNNENIIVLLFHGVPDYLHPWVNTPPELFMEYMKYLYDHHFKVISMRDLNRYQIAK